MPNGNATITDVAKLAEVSVSTVSNLLNGRDERMRPSTRQRIVEAIDQLDYTPNQAARQLKTGQSSILGLIVPSVANPFYGLFAREVEKAALARGYQVLLGNSDRDPERERNYAEELWGYGVRGIIFGSSLVAFTHLHDLIQRGMHVVAFEGPSQNEEQVAIDSIGVDNVQAARLATKHLLALGHRRIGFLSGPIRTVSRLDRLAGYRSALVEAGIAYDASIGLAGDRINFLRRCGCRGVGSAGGTRPAQSGRPAHGHLCHQRYVRLWSLRRSQGLEPAHPPGSLRGRLR